MVLGTLPSWSYWPPPNSLACSSTVNYRSIVISSKHGTQNRKENEVDRVLVYNGISSDYSFMLKLGEGKVQ